MPNLHRVAVTGSQMKSKWVVRAKTRTLALLMLFLSAPAVCWDVRWTRSRLGHEGLPLFPQVHISSVSHSCPLAGWRDGVTPGTCPSPVFCQALQQPGTNSLLPGYGGSPHHPAGQPRRAPLAGDGLCAGWRCPAVAPAVPEEEAKGFTERHLGRC